MTVSKKIYIFLLVIVFLIVLPVSVMAKPGCCSWHGGESGCDGNKTICSDGTISSCPCDGTSSVSFDDSYSDSSYNSEYNDKDNNSLFAIIFWVIVIAGFILWSYIDDGMKKIKRERKQRQKEEETARIRKIEQEKIADVQNLKRNIINKENIDVSFDCVSKDSLCKITSNDIAEIINANVLDEAEMNHFMGKLFQIYADTFDSSQKYNFFESLCDNIVSINFMNNQKLYDCQKFAIKYILKNTSENYKELFLKLIDNDEVAFVRKLLHENLKCKFIFDYKETLDLYYILCDLNDLNLVKLITTKENFIYNSQYMYSGVFEKFLKNRNYKDLKIYCALFQKNIYVDKYDLKIIFDLLTKSQDINLIKCYLDECNDANLFLKKNGAQLIYLLIRRLWIDAIEYILDNYKNINLNVIINGGTPLIYACYKANYKIVKALLDYGVDVNFEDSRNNRALACACKLKKIKICKLLLEHGASLYTQEQNEELKRLLRQRDSYWLSFVSFDDVYSIRKKK